MSAQTGGRIETYCQAWISSLARLLSQLTSADWQVEAAEVPAAHAATVSLQITAEGALEGQQWLSFAAADLGTLLGTFLGEETKLAGELDETQKEATEELIRQWSGLAASALKGDFGEVRLQVAFGPAVHAATGWARLIRAGDDARSITVVMGLDDGLAGSLSKAGEFDAASASAAAPGKTREPSVLPPAANSGQIEELLQQGNLELLMDVELPVMLRFGIRQATLHEVLDLATGAVLELDREIQEPVDLVLNGRVIARGEVVVVDGNYGLRVLDVASPQQRVSSL